MNSYDVIIFDLDGVIIDQQAGITDSVKHALLKFGIVETNYENLLRFIGPPLKNSFMKFYGFNKAKSIKAVEFYRENYDIKGVYEYTVYEGIKSMLKDLNKSGKKLFLATTKPKHYAELILTNAKLQNLFTSIHGETMTGDKTKSIMLNEILRGLNTTALLNVVMVGDRDSDIFAAKENSISSIGVTYGFGSYDELNKAKATHIVNDVKELKKLLLS